MSELKFNCGWCNKEVETDDYGEIHKKGFCSFRCYDNKRQMDFIALGLQDEGFKLDRINYNEREKAFSEVWKKENKQRAGYNYGNGILQDLFMERHQFNIESHFDIKAEHRFVAATIIQWLGSNCGMGFLHETLEKFGYKMTEK